MVNHCSKFAFSILGIVVIALNQNRCIWKGNMFQREILSIKFRKLVFHTSVEWQYFSHIIPIHLIVWVAFLHSSKIKQKKKKTKIMMHILPIFLSSLLEILNKNTPILFILRADRYGSCHNKWKTWIPE